jgi:UDP:flavonoid glycosyltransferase YjiC (YdhE family)
VRILLTAQPAYGHLGPLLPLAHAATAAGHEVEVACAPSFAHAVREAGLTPAPCGIDWTLTGDGLTTTFPDLAEHPGNEAGNRFVIGTVFAERTARATAGDLLAAGAGHRYDVVVRETFELGGLLVAAAAGLPCAVVQVGAHGNFTDHRDAAAAGLKRAGTELDVALERPAAWFDRDALLSFVPPSLQDPEVPLPATARAFRPDVSQADRALPDDVDLSRERTVYMTLGTVFTTSRRIYAAMLEATAELDANVILALGRGLDPAELEPSPPHVRVASFVPQRAVVDRSDLVVCHAGFSTVLDALTAGVPMVLLPYSADQPENAARCAALGVAEVLPLLEMDPGSLRKAIDTVLADDRYAGAARTVRQEIEALPGTGDAVRLLEDLAAGRVQGT